MKKVLCLILVAIMLMTVMPVTSFAGNWLCEITGHDFEWQVTKAATCQSTGTETEICTRSDCGTTRNTRTINLVGHTEHVIPAAPATCDKDGYTAGKVCSVCGYIIEACQTIEKKGHVPVDVPAVDATCTENGKTAGKECSVCGKPISGCTVVVAPGHDWKLTSYKAGSCTTSGEEKYECKVCGDRKTTVLEAEHNYGLWSTVKAATCLKAGKMERTCKECGEKDYKNTEKLPHTEKKTAAVDATCTTDGKTEGVNCSVCGTTIKAVEVVKALGHDYVEDKAAGKAPTCTEAGKYKGTCSRCKDVKEEELKALGHTEEVIAGIPADCTKSGLTKGKKCTVCGEITVPQTETPALGHKVNWTVTKEATCTEKGKQSGCCSACKMTVSEAIPIREHEIEEIDYFDATCTEDGKIVEGCWMCGQIEEEIIIPAKGHNYQSQWQTILNPKCTETGVAIKICKDCLEIQKTDIPSLGHTDVDFDGKCDRCGTTNELPQPEDPADSCSCNCHKSGISGFIWKILCFFYKLFRTNGTCSCGAAHY